MGHAPHVGERRLAARGRMNEATPGPGPLQAPTDAYSSLQTPTDAYSRLQPSTSRTSTSRTSTSRTSSDDDSGQADFRRGALQHDHQPIFFDPPIHPKHNATS